MKHYQWLWLKHSLSLTNDFFVAFVFKPWERVKHNISKLLIIADLEIQDLKHIWNAASKARQMN